MHARFLREIFLVKQPNMAFVFGQPTCLVVSKLLSGCQTWVWWWRISSFSFFTGEMADVLLTKSKHHGFGVRVVAADPMSWILSVKRVEDLARLRPATGDAGVGNRQARKMNSAVGSCCNFCFFQGPFCKKGCTCVSSLNITHILFSQKKN